MSLRRTFTCSAGILLLVTSIAKLVSLSGTAKLLEFNDPLFGFSYRLLFALSGGIEFVIALYCIYGKQPRVQTMSLIWLSCSMVIYRFGLWWLAYPLPCKCLGNLTDALHISPSVADMCAKAILVYILSGSLWFLIRSQRSGDIESNTPNYKLKSS